MAVEAIGHVLVSSSPTTITSSGSSNTKGDWVELIASSAFDATGILLSPVPFTAAGDILFDIGTGAAMSETAILSDIALGMSSANWAFVHNHLVFPISIASGTRISARMQSTSSSTVIGLTGLLIAKDSVDFSDMSSAVTYGANTADSGGVSVDPGADDHTKGAYSEITASTSADIKWITVHFGNQNNTARGANAGWYVDIATGAESAESVVVPDIFVRSAVAFDQVTPNCVGPIPIEIASGTRIAARAQSSETDATDRLLDVIIIGYNGTASGGGGGGGFSAWMG